MPELPETETLARDLNAAVSGAVVTGVAVPRPDVLRGATAGTVGRRLRRRAIVRVWRRAKAVVMDFDDGQRLVVVPRFTGGLLIRPAEAPHDPYDCLRLDLSDGGVLAYRDVRRLGTVTLLTSVQFSTFERRLGQEPLDPAFDASELSALLGSSNQPVKKVLMDQRRIAGIGNIYASETLWAAGIDPSRVARTVSSDEARRLHAAIVRILGQSIAARGTTFRDYRDAFGGRGGFARQLRAYGRGGEPCSRCGTRLTATHAIDGRSTVFCHRCQS